MKCPTCRGCFDRRIVNNRSYYYCFLCNKYYEPYPGGATIVPSDVMKQRIEGTNNEGGSPAKPVQAS